MHGWVQDMEVHPAFFWGRCNGWALMAMVELLDVLPENHPGYDRVMELLQGHIQGLAARQSGWKASGTSYWTAKTLSWRPRPQPFTPTCIARAVNRGWVDPMAYGPVAQLGWNAVQTRVNAEGQVEGTCVGTGMAFDPAFYYYRPVTYLCGPRLWTGPAGRSRGGPAGQDAALRDQRQQRAALQSRTSRGHGNGRLGARRAAGTSPRSGWPPRCGQARGRRRSSTVAPPGRARPRSWRRGTGRRRLARRLARRAEGPGGRRRVPGDAGAPARRAATVAAAEAGGRVSLCEKPRWPSAAGRLRAHDRGGPGPRRAHWSVAFYRRHYPVVARLRRASWRREQIGAPVPGPGRRPSRPSTRGPITRAPG